MITQDDVAIKEPAAPPMALMSQIQIIGSNIGPIFKAISTVMSEMQSAEKDGKHAQNYRYVSWAEVASLVQHKMGQAGLTIMPTVEKAEIVDDSTRDSSKVVRKWHISYRMLIGCSDTDAVLIVPWTGESMISYTGDDKGQAKAATLSMKSFLSKLFMITTKEDEDADGNNIEDAEVRDRRVETRPAERVQSRRNNSSAKTGTSSTHQPDDSSASSEPSSQAPSAPTATVPVSPTIEAPASAEAKPSASVSQNGTKKQDGKPPRTSATVEKTTPAPVPPPQAKPIKIVNGLPTEPSLSWIYEQLSESGAKPVIDSNGVIDQKTTVKNALLKVGYDTTDTSNIVARYPDYIKHVEQMHILEVACQSSGKTLEEALNACELIYNFRNYEVIEPRVMNWLAGDTSGAIIESPEEAPPIPILAETGDFDFDADPVPDLSSHFPDTDPSEIS